MSAPRLAGLFLTALFLTVAAGSAQQGLPPGVKIPPQIKPGFPPGGPVMPGPKQPPVPPGKGNPIPPGKGNPIPGNPPTTPSFPPSGGGGVVVPPAPKKDDVKWPEKVNGKTPAEVVKEMRSHSDPAAREAAVRLLPAFGPKGREEGSTQLVEAMTRDSDLNVRLAAVEVAPTVLFAYATGPDTPLSTGITAMMNLLVSEHMHLRYAAVASVGGIGPYARQATAGKVITTLGNRVRESSSWHMRRAAAAALGSVGSGMQRSEDPADREPPDQGAVDKLLDVLKQDNCALVRREAVNSLIGVGPVAGGQQKKWRADLDAVLTREKDKSVVLWTRVCILLNDPNKVKGNEQHLDAIAKLLQAPEPGGRLEACQALAMIGEDATSKLEDLLHLVQNVNEKPEIVGAGIVAIAAMKTQAKITVPVMDRIKVVHPNEDVRKMAAEASDILTGRKKA